MVAEVYGIKYSPFSYILLPTCGTLISIFFFFQVSRQSLDVVVEVAKKEEMFVQCKSGGLEKVKVADSSVDERALTSEQAVTIAQLMMELEQKMKRPQDFEWGIQDG